MASIQGLTIIINGDATPLTKAMRQAKSESATLRMHMSALNSLLRFDPSSMVLVTRQQQLMNAQLSQAAGRLATLRAAHAEYAELAGAMTEAEVRQFQRLQRELTQAELEYARLRAQAVEMGVAANASTLAFAGGLEKFSANLKKVSAQALALSTAIYATGAAALWAAVEFENSFAGVRKTIIATDDEYRKLAESTRQIALTKPIDVNDVNEIMMYAGQLGVANENLTKFASTMADLDVATDMDLEEGSMQLARFMNICRTGEGDVDRLGATIVDLGNNSATTESQIMLMAMRIAGTASNVGMTAQNVLALATALSSAGIQAEMGGNAIATIIRRIDKDVDKNSETLSVWANVAGMSASEFASAWKGDVAGAFQAVIRGMGDFQDAGGSLNLLLDDLHISYMRQVDTMQRLARTGDMLEGYFARADTAWASNTALVREATQRYDTAASKMQIMKNSINEAGIVLGNELLPCFKDVVVSVTGAIQAFASMDDGMKTAIIDTAALVAGSGLLVKGLEVVAGSGAKAIRMFASMKTALELFTMGEMTYTNMKIVQTAQITGNTAALEANNLAMVQNRSVLAVLQDGYIMAGLRIEAFAAKVGLSTAAMLGVAGAAAVGVAALIAFVGYIVESSDATDELTASSQRSARAAADAEARYRELAASEGETSDAALAAKAAMEEQQAAFEDSKETVGEFCARMDDLVEAHQKTSESMAEAKSGAESEAGSILLLVDRINELAAVQDDDINRKSELVALANDLNGKVSGLNLVYDASTGALKSNAESWEAVARAQANALRNDAYLNNFNSAVAEGIDLEIALAEVTDELTAAHEEWRAASERGEWNTYKYQDAVSKLEAEEKELAQAIEDNNSKRAMYLKLMGEQAKRDAAAQAALSLVNDELYTQQEAIDAVNEKYGILLTAEDLATQAASEEAEAIAEDAEEFQNLSEKIDELTASYPSLLSMLEAAGVSTAEFAQMMQDAGLSADDLEKSIADMVDKVTDGFDKMEADTEVSLEEFMANMQSNAQMVSDWKDNVTTLYGMAASSFEVDYIDYIVSLGPEHANLVASLIGDHELLSKYADQYSKNTAAAVEAGATDVQSAMARERIASQETAASLNSAGEQTAADQRRNMGEFVKAIQDGKAPTAVAAAAIAAATIGMNAQAKFAWTWGNEMAKNFANGLGSRSSVNVVSAAAGIIASAAKNVLGHSVPKSGPLHEGGRGEVVWGEHLVENIISGFRNREGDYLAEVNRLAEMTRDPFGGFSATRPANWMAAARPATAAAAAQPAGDTYYFGDITVSADDLEGIATVSDFAKMVIRTKAANPVRSRRR